MVAAGTHAPRVAPGFESLAGIVGDNGIGVELLTLDAKKAPWNARAPLASASSPVWSSTRCCQMRVSPQAPPPVKVILCKLC